MNQQIFVPFKLEFIIMRLEKKLTGGLILTSTRYVR